MNKRVSEGLMKFSLRPFLESGTKERILQTLDVPRLR